MARSLSVFLSMAVLLSSPIFAQQGVIEAPQEVPVDAAVSLQHKLQGMNSFAARFVQVQLDEDGETLQQTVGEAKLKKPGKMLWSSHSPFESQTISSNGVVWHYDVDLEQVTREPLSEDMSQTPALLLGSDQAALEKSFDIRRLDSDRAVSLFELKNKDVDALFSSLELGFDEAGQLSLMNIVDGLDQRTEIVFTERRFNLAIDDSVFDFQVPEHVDLIDNGE